MDQIISGALDQPRDDPNPYDLWLEGRLQDGRDSTWLASQSIYAATNFCRLLGAELSRLDPEPGQQSAPEYFALRAAQASGFKVAAQGEAEIKAALDRLAEHAGASTDTAQKAFGQIFIKFRNDYKNDADFAQLRNIVRDSILENWAIAEGEEVLGEIVTERRLHSVYTAAKEVGTTKARLAQLLVEVGALTQDDTRPPHRRVFDARQNAPFMAAVTSMASLRDLRKAMGATRNEIDALIEEEILTPVATIPGLRACWSLTDGLRLVEELRALADPLPQRATGWENILAAKNRSMLAISDILQGLRDGRFRAGLSPVKPGFGSVYVAKADINRLARSVRVSTEALRSVVCPTVASGRRRRSTLPTDR